MSVRVNAYSAENKIDGLSLHATILDPSNNIVGNISAPLKKDNDGNLTAELSMLCRKTAALAFDKPHLYRFVCRLMRQWRPHSRKRGKLWNSQSRGQRRFLFPQWRTNAADGPRMDARKRPAIWPCRRAGVYARSSRRYEKTQLRPDSVSLAAG